MTISISTKQKIFKISSKKIQCGRKREFMKETTKKKENKPFN